MATHYQNSVIEIIVGLFDAAPGKNFLDDFSEQMISGIGRVELTNVLTNTQAFKELYSDGLSTNEFASEFIGRLVGDTASPENKAWAIESINNQLVESQDRASTMLNTIDALLKVSFDNEAWGNTAQLFANKVYAAAQYSIVNGNSSTSVDELQKAIKEQASTPLSRDDQIVLSMDFDHHESGHYIDEQISEDTGIKLDRVQRNEKTNDQIAIETIDGDQMLRITHPEGEVQSGFQAYIDLDQDYDKIYVSYDLILASDFDQTTSLGGKLLGVSGAPDGMNAPTGGSPPGTDEGFSARNMHKQGDAIQYIYEQQMTGTYPDSDDYWDYTGDIYQFPLGEVLHIEQYVSMNTPGDANGVSAIWVSGDLVSYEDGYIFSESGSYGIGQLNIDFWTGGKNADWYPANDSVMWIDDILVSTVPVSELSDEITVTGVSVQENIWL